MGVKESVKQIKAAKDSLKQLEQKFRLVTTRNIQQTSGGTFFVCLPKEWAKKVGVEKGAKVTVAWSQDDTLTIIA